MILGTAQIGMDYGVANKEGAPSVEQAFQILDKAYAGGIHLLDTAAAYGQSEEIIARYLAEHNFCFGVCTKLSTHIQGDDLEDAAYLGAVQRVEKLGVDFLECLYLHRFDQCLSKSIMNGLQKAKDDGWIKAVGVSIYHPNELEYISDILADQVDVVQIPLNVLMYEKWKPYLEQAKCADLKLFARSVFLQGLLLMESDSREVLQLGAEKYISEVERAANLLGVSRKEFCYQAIRSLPQIDEVIVGCDNEEQLKNNITLEQGSISADQLEMCMNETDSDLWNPPITITNPSLWRRGETRRKIHCIIQARMGSTRLPGKVLMEINGKPLVGNLVSRVKDSNYLDHIVVATTDDEADDPLVAYCKENAIDCYRGDELDVLDRYYSYARKHGADVVVRLTSDNPFICAEHIDQALELFLQADGLDYLNFRKGLPLGLHIEVISFEALESAWKESKSTECREHVTPYFYKNPTLFHCFYAPGEDEADYSSVRLTVDTLDDLDTAKGLYAELPDNFKYEDIISLVLLKPELLKNSAVQQEKIKYSGEGSETRYM